MRVNDIYLQSVELVHPAEAFCDLNFYNHCINQSNVDKASKIVFNVCFEDVGYYRRLLDLTGDISHLIILVELPVLELIHSHR